MTINIEQLRKDAEERKQTLIEEARIKAEISKLTNETLIQAQANMALVAETSNKLKELITVCSTIVTDVPIYNNRTREQRKFMGRKSYGMGNQVALLHELLTGIQYSSAEHKQLMLSATGLSEDLVETAIEAFGSQPYYSSNYQDLVEAIPYNLPSLMDSISLIELELGITLDKSKLTTSNLDYLFERSQLIAERTRDEALTTASLGQQLIDME